MAEDMEPPPLFETVNIKRDEDEDEDDLFASAVQVCPLLQFVKVFDLDF